MEKIITINKDYNTLEKLFNYLKNASIFECSKEYDIWEHRVNNTGQMEQCIVLKKSAMHGVKIHLTKENKLKMVYIIPNKMMNAYFGKSVKIRRNIIEIIADKVKEAILAPAQKNAFKEFKTEINKLAL